jgi:hypothetical protein
MALRPFHKGRARENTSGGWRLRFFLPFWAPLLSPPSKIQASGFEEQAVEVVLVHGLVGATVLKQEVGQG